MSQAVTCSVSYSARTRVENKAGCTLGEITPANGLLPQRIKPRESLRQIQLIPGEPESQGLATKGRILPQGLWSRKLSQESEDYTPNGILTQGIKPNGKESQGSKLLEVSRKQGDNNSEENESREDEIFGRNSQKLPLLKQSDYYLRRHNPKEPKPQNFTQVIGSGSGPKEVTPSCFSQAPSGSNSKGATYLGTESQVFEGIERGPPNAYSVLVTNDASAFCFRSFKTAWLGAIALLWYCFQSICMPIRNLLSQTRPEVNCVENETMRNGEIKKTLSEKSPLYAKNIPSEETDVVNLVTGVEKELSENGSHKGGTRLQIQQTDGRGGTSSITLDYMEVKESLVSKRCTLMQEVLSVLERPSLCTVTGQGDGYKLSAPQNDQDNRTTKGEIEEAIDLQDVKDDVGGLSVFNESKDKEEDYKNDHPEEFPQLTGGDGLRGVQAPLDQKQGRSVKEISPKETNGDNHKAKDVLRRLSNTYCIEVNDDQSTLHRSSFKVAWIRAINIILHCLQNMSMRNSNSVKKIGAFKLSVKSEKLRSGEVKVTHSDHKDTVTTFKGNGKFPNNDNADGSMASGQPIHEENCPTVKKTVETVARQEDLNGIDHNHESADDRDIENGSIVDQLDIEDEDQLDMVLGEAQGNGYIIENPAPVIQMAPWNPMAHVPPLDQRPDAHNILPVWLLAFQAHLANVQAQAQAPPAEPTGPNEEAPVNAQPAQANHENAPIDDDDEADVDEVEGGANAAVNDDVPANEDAAPPPPPPPVPPPQLGQQHPQQPHPNGPRNRLLAAARYIKRKFRRNHNHGHPMYHTGAPREERSPLGLEEAAPFPGGLAIQYQEEAGEQEERRPRWLSRCFGFLYRHHSAVVQEYPLQGDEAPEFEEVGEVQEDVHAEIVEEVAEQVVADEEPFEGLQVLQEPVVVL